MNNCFTNELELHSLYFCVILFYEFLISYVYLEVHLQLLQTMQLYFGQEF